ncbi:50S ribosomal protein L11 methyltransferase [Methanocaldococcus indicus]|uniref:50S ribosomal protein L11 methyltransferase n=1 Tax=Methanocaldococcus indicus TaxID=213231 RepID=UPI003C6D0D38
MKLKIKAPQWHNSLLTDYERLAIFKEAIESVVKPHHIVYDLGTGSGILAMIAGRIAKKVYAIELDSFTYEYVKENIELNNFKNIEAIEGDAEIYNFKEKADVIIAEMLDTALITEPQVKVINSIHRRGLLKYRGKLIPERVVSSAQIVESPLNYIHYDEDDKYRELSNEVIYEEVNFYKINDLEVEYIFNFKLDNINKNLALKLRTYTILTNKHISGNLKMLNPPLVIPFEANKEEFSLLLRYKRGGDLESIKVEVL